jgi:hypothetical protein
MFANGITVRDTKLARIPKRIAAFVYKAVLSKSTLQAALSIQQPGRY